MPHPATEKIAQLLDHRGIPYQRINHPPCRSSEESAKARAAGGGKPACGAKAIVVKMNWRGAGSEFNVLVLPGFSKIASNLLLDHLPSLKAFRFATPAELAAQTDGLEPGMMPPFGRPIFEGLNRILVDSGLIEHDNVGFNAADLMNSFILSSQDYMKAAAPNDVFRFATMRSEA
jgi:prolyl-tRNA editing enzyme YbaK/EbsC (Cys-tRNA(Pro) deacylase)